MVNIGVDFGSTYTLISVYRNDMNVLETINLDQGSPYIPSVVAFDSNNNFEIGRAGKNRTGKKGVKIYKTFKMVLTENIDSKQLALRGFDSINTPVKITSLFLENILKKLLDSMHEDKIGKLVIGIPEIWSNSKEYFDGKEVLKNICKNFNFVDNVQVVSEPAAASAYFAYNFYMKEKRNFNGNILLIDYGGGTLDITLTNVSGDKLKDNVEIKVLSRTGVGENEEGKIGQAGVAFMETVMEKSILKNESFKDCKSIKYDEKFYKAVDDLESELQTRTEPIEFNFSVYGQDIEKLNDMEFTTIEYMSYEIVVTYGTLLSVYNSIIYDTVDNQLNKMINYMVNENINYKNGEGDKFKIALAGGFGNFYLVKKQIYDKFAIGTNDRRTTGIVKNESDCIKAISLGTALLANNIINIINTADFSIGLYSYLSNKLYYNYAIKYKQKIEFEKVYYLTDSNTDKLIFKSLSGGIEKFIVNFSLDDDFAKEATPKKEFINKLKNITKSKHKTFAIGFSMDTSGIISLHICDYNIENDSFDNCERVIELAKFNDLFDEKTFKGVNINEV